MKVGFYSKTSIKFLCNDMQPYNRKSMLIGKHREQSNEEMKKGGGST